MTTTIADAARSHTFGRSRPFQIGVEEELFLADPRTLQVVHRADEVLARRRFARGKVLGEICDGMIELVTPPCPSPGQARRHLGDLRRKVLAGGDVVLLGTGVHPTTPFAAVVPRRGRYYEEILEASGDLLRQTAYCGVHVHVGLPDPETAVTALNGMRKWVPLLQALSANSPFWHDRDSGLASARSARCAGMPRTGLPRRFADWADYAATVDDLCRVGELPGPSAIWWDVRLQPRLGTLEVRCLDAQSSLAELGSLVALVQGLVRHEAT